MDIVVKLGAILFMMFMVMYYIVPPLFEVLGRYLRENVTPTGHSHKWEYDVKQIDIKEKHITLNVHIRTCTKCGQRQHYTMLPRANGRDYNRWKNDGGKLVLMHNDEELIEI